MGRGFASRATRKILRGPPSARAIAIAFPQGATAAAGGSGADASISAACTGPFNWTGGDLTITNTGSISGGYSGITIAGGDIAGTLTNSGSIGGVYPGIVISGYVASIGNDGSIVGGATGLQNTGTLASLTNSGTINGHFLGIDNGGSIGTITNAGAISGFFRNTATIDALYNNLGAATDYIYNAGTITLLSNEGLIDNGGLNNDGTIATLTNDGTIRSNGSSAPILNGGVIGTLTNNGLITGPSYALENYSGTIELVNNGQITGGMWNTGLMLLTNAGTIAGNIYNFGTITQLDNQGVIASGSVTAIRNDNGQIGTITNTGLISAVGCAVCNISAATIQLVNAGTIEGDITNYGGLTISGGTGATIGTLTGGTIIGDVVFSGGNLLLDDDGLGAGLSNTGATLQVNRTLTLVDGNGTISSFSQSGGTLQFGALGGLAVSGTANVTGGSITVAQDPAGNYTYGQTRTIIAADDSSSYTGAAVTMTGVTPLTYTQSTTNGDLVFNYTNDYFGGTLASFSESHSISGGQYAVYVASTGNIGTLTNSGTIYAPSGNSKAATNTVLTTSIRGWL